VVRGVAGLIGNTPLMRIESLSELTGCEILGKAEYLNPAGSPKDRVALQILLDAESSNLLIPHSGDTVFEGTVGSTGISLATLCRAKGYKCAIVLPDDVATEKAQLLEKLGAQVKKVRPRGIVDPRHFVNEARANAIAFEDEEAERERDGQEGTRRPRGFFADQFETTSNFTAHYRGTGPEIWAQCGGGSDDTRRPQLDAFVAGAGTGGTLSGVAAALREREVKPQASREAALEEHASIRIVLADPHGSGLFNKVHHGVMYSSTEAEGTRRRHQVDSIVEGIGMNRITRNLSFGVHLVDDAVRVQDEEAVRISRWLSVRDGLFVGSSSCVNVVAAVRTALRLKKEWEEKGKEGRPTVVTILCDSGVRHLSKFHN
ncbi:pyridoxal phosphate-dependent enzyme, beta subunit, partial [Jaminaea rosea]